MQCKPTSGAFLALLSMVSAQTHTVCDPTKKECPPNPAFAGDIDIDFTKGENDFFEAESGTDITYDKQKGAEFTIEKEEDAPTIESPEFIFFGKIEVELMAAPGAGIVTSVVLQSLALDEIDWEWVGGAPDSVQTNYFSKGDTSTYDRGGTHPVSNVLDFHIYTIDWTEDALAWSVDGKEVRVLKYADSKGGKEYPQTPMQVKLGTWVAGRPGAAQGTVDWAGGLASFDQPSRAYYRRVSVTDYAGGVEGAKQYIYSDKSGMWESILIETEDGGVTKKKPGDKDDEEDDDKDKDEDKSSADAAVKPTASTTGTVKPTASTTGTSKDGEATESPAEAGDETPNAPAAAPASVKALTWVCAVVSGAAVLANVL